MIQSHATTASHLRTGDRMLDLRTQTVLTVHRVVKCADGSLRVITDLDDQRMTGSVCVRVLH